MPPRGYGRNPRASPRKVLRAAATHCPRIVRLITDFVAGVGELGSSAKRGASKHQAGSVDAIRDASSSVIPSIVVRPAIDTCGPDAELK